MTGVPPKRLVFHLGFQKTGTTSIQRLLNENAARLPDLHIRAYGDATKELRRSGLRYCRTGAAPDRAALEQALDRALAHFADVPASVGIISDENLIGRVGYDATGHVLLWADRVLPVLSARARDVAPEFVFYTRTPERWFRSLYNQAVKRGRVTARYERWRADVPFELDWPAWRARFEAASGRPVTFLSMEAEIASGRPLGAGLLIRAGIAPARIETLSPVAPENASLSQGALEVMRLVNRLPLSHSRLMKVSEWVERHDRGRDRARALERRGAGHRA